VTRSEKFSLGRIVATVDAVDKMSDLNSEGNHRRIAAPMIARHHRGEWGEICKEDAKANDDALQDGARIVSLYKEGDQEFFVITEAEDAEGLRRSTTLMLSEDY